MNSILLDATQAKSVAGSKPPAAAGKGVDASFGEWLDRSIQSVNQMQQAADASAVKLASGAEKDIHGTMIAMQKADIAMTLLLEVRNKLISAYDEIKRMQF